MIEWLVKKSMYSGKKYMNVMMYSVEDHCNNHSFIIVCEIRLEAPLLQGHMGCSTARGPSLT